MTGISRDAKRNGSRKWLSEEIWVAEKRSVSGRRSEQYRAGSGDRRHLIVRLAPG